MFELQVPRGAPSFEAFFRRVGNKEMTIPMLNSEKGSLRLTKCPITRVMSLSGSIASL